MFSEELKNGGICSAIIFLAELPVSSALYREQLIGNASLVERLSQSNRLAVGDHIVGITVNRDNGWIILAHIDNRRSAPRDFLFVRQTAEPGDRVIPAIRTCEQLGYISNSEAVYDSCNPRLGFSFVCGAPYWRSRTPRKLAGPHHWTNTEALPES